ncbi:MAG: ATP-dependent transcriptional regulator, MalT-like, LuxR family [Fluviicola sp.]|jgi:DNA-binding CsgD family transcriptional regulator|uniref:helix-turn-helix transcriptional regulator n=1 Tax=Fluviicola sp. TaxID=1917219 RepID=UPI002616DF74|nr:LuxR C-terminal-related transcriptional regulator [Fluviicola sp.]MDF3026085.1 ATP-dependent transcriptional regulator, MalT-like, LuxR family [Fluviicola sp.]
MLRNLFKSYKLILLYAVSLAALLFLMRWLEFRLLMIDHATELYAAVVAIVFMVLGIWLAKHLSKPKTVLVEKTVYLDQSGSFERNEKALVDLGISKRELEVLELMAQGLSNNEIAERLFVSLNTVKTHASKLFEKLEVSRRTQAVESAKRMGIIPL